MEATPANRVLWRLARDLGAELGLKLEEGLAGGGSDGSTASLYTATLDGLGPVGDGAHARHEHLLIDRTIERTALLAMLIQAPPLERADEPH
jgi:glutamate carboxypeptidase